MRKIFSMILISLVVQGGFEQQQARGDWSNTPAEGARIPKAKNEEAGKNTLGFLALRSAALDRGGLSYEATRITPTAQAAGGTSASSLKKRTQRRKLIVFGVLIATSVAGAIVIATQRD